MKKTQSFAGAGQISGAHQIHRANLIGWGLGISCAVIFGVATICCSGLDITSLVVRKDDVQRERADLVTREADARRLAARTICGLNEMGTIYVRPPDTRCTLAVKKLALGSDY